MRQKILVLNEKRPCEFKREKKKKKMSDEERSVQADHSSSYLASPEDGKPQIGRKSGSRLQGVSP